MRRFVSIAAASILCSGGAAAALPEGIAGPWYNPAQSGHGLSISLADRGTRGVVLWHVYDPEGAPLTLYVDAVVDGRTLEGPVFAPRGMRFGEFDPSDITLPEWGRVQIVFDDCDRATLHWDANDPAYVDGSMSIARLGRIATLDCVLPPPNRIPAGLYARRPGGMAIGGYDSGLGIVDREGRLWALSGQRDESGIRLADIPGPTFVSAFQPQLFLGTPLGEGDDRRVQVELAQVEPNWAWNRGRRTLLQGSWEQDAGALGRFPDPASGASDGLVWEPAAAGLARLVAPVDAAALAGSYRYTLRGQFISFVRSLRIDADGNADLGDFVGHVAASEGEHGLVDFQLRSRSNPWLRPYSGRGWVDDSPRGRRLVLIGDNGSNGFAVVATREEDAR